MRHEAAPDVSANPGTSARDRANRAYRTCPVCGADLADRSCKLRCETPGCGYYLSCSDFY